MKFEKLYLLLLPFLLFSCSENRIDSGNWRFRYDTANKGVRVEKNTEELFSGLYASYKLDGEEITSKDYGKRTIKITPFRDDFGNGEVMEIKYTDTELPTLVHLFYVYPEKDYFLTEVVLLASSQKISTNYIAPVVVDNMKPVLPAGDNRALFMPFDNDCWIRYQSHPLTFEALRSYEVTAVFNNETRNGWVIGSVEHDLWKTGIDMKKGDRNNPGALVCYGGVADTLTRDSKVHGSLSGKQIKSPKVLVGYFNDWREGLVVYGKANATVTPRREWSKAVPFGWNSWGALQFDLNYRNATEVSNFFKENLQNNHFVNPDNTVVIWLDSGWNAFTEEELKNFADLCRANGQIPGIYWTPFTDWGRNPERAVLDVPEYTYKDVYLYANGQPQELDGAYAVDPTRPAIEQQMKHISGLFRRTGFEYVKMDFMTHGAMEADSWYLPHMQTGMEAYNYGMKLLDNYFHDMYLNLSISPVFPAQYAQSRRIACDAWNKIKDTEYTLNALSYGWWQDNIYTYNDADHIVLREATEGENRARITSGVITGIYIVGDDFSATGKAAEKDRARRFLTNPKVNAVAQGISFMPVEGNGEQSENQFVLVHDDGSATYAIFNYTENELETTVSLERIGLNSNQSYQAEELWSGMQQTVEGSFTVRVPAKDVLLFNLNLYQS